MYIYAYLCIYIYIHDMKDNNNKRTGKTIGIILLLQITHTTCKVVLCYLKVDWISYKYTLQALGQPLNKDFFFKC